MKEGNSKKFAIIGVIIVIISVIVALICVSNKKDNIDNNAGNTQEIGNYIENPDNTEDIIQKPLEIVSGEGSQQLQ